MINISYTCDKCKKPVPNSEINIIIIENLNHSGDTQAKAEYDLCNTCWKEWTHSDGLVVQSQPIDVIGEQHG